MSQPSVEHPARFLVDHGILFELNRQVLHPLGLELHFDVRDDGGLAGIELLDNRASPEPIYFSPEAFEEGRQKYERYLADAGRRNMQKRRQLGVLIQTGPNLPRQFHERPDRG
jgi:hypothetical protein